VLEVQEIQVILLEQQEVQILVGVEEVLQELM